jgi:hypothetical protein
MWILDLLLIHLRRIGDRRRRAVAVIDGICLWVRTSFLIGSGFRWRLVHQIVHDLVLLAGAKLLLLLRLLDELCSGVVLKNRRNLKNAIKIT